MQEHEEGEGGEEVYNNNFILLSTASERFNFVTESEVKALSTAIPPKTIISSTPILKYIRSSTINYKLNG